MQEMTVAANYSLVYNLQAVVFVFFFAPATLTENDLIIFRELYIYTGEINK